MLWLRVALSWRVIYLTDLQPFPFGRRVFMVSFLFIPVVPMDTDIIQTLLHSERVAAVGI